MIRKIILASVIASQLLVSCSKDDPTPAASDSSLDSEIAQLIQKPYSDLTPSQQKVKLENEANSALDQMDNLKSAGAIEALQTLEYVMNIGNSIDIMNGKNDNHVTDLLNISGVYGTYTWDNTHHVWVKTASTSNLKFVFPSKKSQLGINNAVLTSTAVASNVKVDVTDTEGQATWEYNNNTGQYDYITSPEVLDNLYLPSSVAATLTIDNVQAATLTAENAYPSGENIPSSASYKVALNDGYVWEQKGIKGSVNSFSSSLSYKGSNIISFSSGASADIDAAIAQNDMPSDLGKINYMVKIMDNLVQVANVDVQYLSEAENNNSDNELDYYSPNYYTALNSQNKSDSEAAALAFNTNVKMALVSQKDGTKIADVIMKSEKGDSYTDHVVWNADYEYWEWDDNSEQFVQEYNEVQYLRFSDNTLVSMEVYFSSGFTILQTNFDDFLTKFND